MFARGVVLVGFMGVGKSAVGRALASKLGWPHVDSDEELIREYGPIAEQFLKGEHHFRSREAAMIVSWCDGACRVLSVGGGALQTPGTWQRLQEAYRTVWLDAPLATCASRVGDAKDRPLFDADVEKRFEVRRARYAEASVRVDATRGNPEEVASAVLEALCIG